ncbi:MAG: 23S rRNA (adenine(2503)-C(2))-methyltransferase RlmN, partial [Candidatus Magasanikbacteria bacterium]
PEARIANIVFMGQGEPLLNYENIKKAILILLENTDIGETHIVLSTVGIIPGMKKILEDTDFPPIRVALSLHSAVFETRQKLIPSHQEDFFQFLIDWGELYHEKFPSKPHFIGIEYIMIQGINDDEKHLKALIKLISKLGTVRVNLIPYNSTCDDIFTGSSMNTLNHWQERLMDSGFICTIRKSQGQDIAAACGQLALKTGK